MEVWILAGVEDILQTTMTLQDPTKISVAGIKNGLREFLQRSVSSQTDVNHMQRRLWLSALLSVFCCARGM